MRTSPTEGRPFGRSTIGLRDDPTDPTDPTDPHCLNLNNDPQMNPKNIHASPPHDTTHSPLSASANVQGMNPESGFPFSLDEDPRYPMYAPGMPMDYGQGMALVRQGLLLPGKPGQSRLPVIGRLAAWASHHSVDFVSALLVCSCGAAHLAGPMLRFRRRGLLGGHAPPTIVGLAEDTGLHNATVAALESLEPMEQTLMLKSRGLGREYLADAMRLRDRCDRNHTAEVDTDKRVSPLGKDVMTLHRHVRYEALTRARFLWPGEFPTKPEKELAGFHLGSAFATGALERLPRTDRARDIRVNTMRQAMTGVSLKTSDRHAVTRDSTGSIRGIIRFMSDDLEWLVRSRPDFMLSVLPLVGVGGQPQIPLEDSASQVTEFDLDRRTVLYSVLELRRESVPCDAEFRNKEAEAEFVKQKAAYNDEARALSYPSHATVALPDLFAWYLLQLCEASNTRPEETEIVQMAFSTARELRQRAEDFYSLRSAVGNARERLMLAAKLVERMRELDKPCKRRELVRGLNNQRMDILGPVIESLLGLGVFREEGGLLSLCPEAGSRQLLEHDFMEPSQGDGESGHPKGATNNEPNN